MKNAEDKLRTLRRDEPYLTGSVNYRYSSYEQDFIDLKEVLDLVEAKYIFNSSEKVLIL